MKPILRYGFVLISFVVGLSSSLSAQWGNLEPNDSLPTDSQVITGTLANGLRYYIRKNAKPEQRAELRLAVRTGSIMEDDDQQGLAHFCEHMCFNGTKRFPKQDLVNFLESTGIRFGAHLNAYTSFDETVYMLQAPTDKPEVLGKAMDVLEDWAGSVTFDNTEIDKERGVVIEEWRLGRGANERVENKLLPSVLFNSRYAVRLPIGKKEILDTFRYETLKKFYRDWYRPDLMAVIAVGDFDPIQMQKMIIERFSRLSNPPAERERTAGTLGLHAEPIFASATDKELQQPSFDIYFQYEDKEDKIVADYRNNIVGELYAEMLNDRLEEISLKADAPFAQSFVHDETFLGKRRSYEMNIVPKSSSLKKAYEAGLQELFRVRQNGFVASELERAKKNMLTRIERLYNEREKTDSRALVREYLDHFLHKDPFPGIAYEYQLYKRYLSLITVDEVNRMNDVYFGKNVNRVVTLAASEKEGVHVPDEKELRETFYRIESSQLAAYEDKAADEPLMAQKPAPGRVVRKIVHSGIGVSELQLSNGIKVILKPTDFKNDEVLFSATSPGGSSLSSDQDYLSAEQSAQVVSLGGAGKFDLITLQKMLAGKTASCTPSIAQLSEGMNGSCTPKDMETMFQLIYLYSTAPRKDTAACKSYLNRIKSFLENRSNDPNAAFGDTLQVTMSNYHHRGRPISMALLSEIDIDKAFDFYRDRFSDMGDFTFYFVGSFDEKTIRPFIETYLASLPTKKRKESWRDIGMYPPKGTIEKKVVKGIEPKSNVRIVHTGDFKWTPENRFALQAMAEVLSIKLRETLREEKGGVYGVQCRANPTHYPKETYSLSVGFGCAPERVNELVAEVYKKLDTMTMKPPEEVYVNKVKQIQKRENEVNMKENRYWLSSLSQAYVNKEKPEDILKRKQMIESLSPKLIFDAAKKYCTKENLVKVVLVPEKTTGSNAH